MSWKLTEPTNIRKCIRQVSRRKVAVSKAAVVACIKKLHTPDIQHEHCSAQNMTRSVSTHLQRKKAAYIYAT